MTPLVIRMMLQIVGLPRIVILMTLKVSSMLLEETYSTCITQDDNYFMI